MGISGMLKEPESKEFKDACLHFEEVMKDPVAYTMAHPTKQNMKGFRAWVSGPQGVQYAVFFYGTSEIINSTIDLQLQYNDLLETAYGIDFSEVN